MKLFPWFQPIIEIATGRVAGYEALARTEDASGQVVSAGAVFNDPVYSATEQLAFDRDVRRQALAQCQHLQPGQFITLNISPQWIDSLPSLDVLPTLEMLKEAGVAPGQVVIEITELDGDIERIKTLAERYRAEGVRIAFDDFGTGFQQLDRLLAFTPDFIKLDMRMFSNSASMHHKRTLLQMVGDLGAKLGSKIICEGVETADEFFLALHCNASYVQGYIFDSALPEFLPQLARKEQVSQLLAQHLDLAVDVVTRSQWHAEGLNTELLALRDLLLSSGAEGLAAYQPDADVLRFYLCDREGIQISPNYTYDYPAASWVEDASFLGNNWSWRAYFYQLIGAADFERRILRSSPYLDLETGLSCYTLSLALDERRILLVDIREQMNQSRISATISCQSDLMPSLS
ncbi:EAL domain-containing protein [Nitrincola tapanii]|uniref:EAL domain-containing protein n=1 Tax=Nitrincola tapanii TaxID=1708751 RepID=A0A5A9W4Y6_9GAMM|nr:EAL domain-containing protein [Nitrincola tapanii]KAA0875148.1 EAL domain-containing protein [Nitrincola tapanii]